MLLATNLVSGSSSAQRGVPEDKFLVRRFAEADGMISTDVTGTYLDSRGFLWISTFEGLSRFDGRHFENYDRSSGLVENNIGIIGEDEAGHLYFNTNADVYRFTGNGSHPFEHFPGNGRFILTAAPAGRGQLWVAYRDTPGLVLLGLGGATRWIKTGSSVEELLRSKSGDAYALELQGRLSLITSSGLQQVAIPPPQQPFFTPGMHLSHASDGQVWCYPANSAWIYLLHGAGVADSIAVPAAGAWWSVQVGDNKHLFHSSDAGSVFQKTGEHWEALLDKAFIQGNVYEMREITNGPIWISSSAGLLCLRDKQFSELPYVSPLHYFTTDRNGQYIHRADSLLYRIPGAVENYTKLIASGLRNAYVSSDATVFYILQNDVFYLPLHGKLQRLDKSDAHESPASIYKFRTVLEDDAGGYWITSYNGIFYLKGNNARYYFQKKGLLEYALYTSAIDRSGTFFTAGVKVHAFKNDRFQDISATLGLRNDISRLCTDGQKRVWICQGSNRIICIGNDKNGGWQAVDSQFLYIDNQPLNVTSMCFDGRDNLWICDRKALYCYTRHGDERLNGRAPMVWNEPMSGTPLIYADDSGNVHIVNNPLSAEGLRIFNADSLIAHWRQEPLRLYLTGVLLRKQAFDWQGAGFETDPLGVPVNLRLHPRQNFLRFQFAGITTGLSSPMLYRYRMRGYEEEWSPVSVYGEAEYTGLPAGNFVLEVQARTGGGPWSKPLRYAFTIERIWYLRWWAVMLWSLLGLGIISVAIYLRWGVIKRRAAIRQLVIEEQLKALRAQINPHFLQNTFAFLAHELSASHNSAGLKVLDRISAYLRHVLALSDRAVVSLEEELEFAEQYLELQQRLLSIPFEYRFTIDDDVDTFDIQVPSMLLQPIIENALKYGLSSDGPNLILVGCRLKGSFLICTITDTGGKAVLHSAFSSGKGLRLTIDRMNLFYANRKHQPDLQRATNEHGGCIVTIAIPLQ